MQIVRDVKEPEIAGLEATLRAEKRPPGAGLREVRGENAFYIAAKDGDQVVGAATLFFGEVAELHKLYVAPSCRRQGVSKMLLRESLNWCRDLGSVQMSARAITDAGFAFLMSARNDFPHFEIMSDLVVFEL
jgi:GNAT superfamily N-acetyltransferase